MDSNESESKFDNLTRVSTLELQSNRITSVPSIKNMRELTTLLLATNKIRTIKPGDFAGAEKLFVLSLDNNGIVSVAAEAFVNLKQFRVVPKDFNPKMEDGSPYVNAYGLPIAPHPNDGTGYFGGNFEWGFIPIGFSPNPAECVWIGPNMGDFDCSTCFLGYETTSTSDTTCIQPEFRPHKGWADSSDRTLLKIPDTQRADGDEAKASTNTPVLLTGQTCTIPAPRLEPKERMFVGYAQPYTSIRHELDFTRGAEVVRPHAFASGMCCRTCGWLACCGMLWVAARVRLRGYGCAGCTGQVCVWTVAVRVPGVLRGGYGSHGMLTSRLCWPCLRPQPTPPPPRTSTGHWVRHGRCW